MLNFCDKFSAAKYDMVERWEDTYFQEGELQLHLTQLLAVKM